MRTTAAVLKSLRESRAPVSGARLASRLGLTRAAVWGAIQVLRDQGYDVRGVPNRGYSLLSETDRLSAAGIESWLSSFWEGALVRTYEQVTSTNTLAKQMAVPGKKLLLAAKSQSAGRGRRGRDFFSPADAGLYFSLALDWERREPPVLVTTMMAVAAVRVLEKEFGLSVQIKWVNDLYLGARKVGGILTEAVMGLESGRITTLVTGMGLNLREPQGGYPSSIRQSAGALFGEGTGPGQNRLIAMIANDLGDLIQGLPDRGYLDLYRERCFILGKKIRLDTGQVIVPHAISDDGALLYREGDQIRSLQTGEVSILL